MGNPLPNPAVLVSHCIRLVPTDKTISTLRSWLGVVSNPLSLSLSLSVNVSLSVSLSLSLSDCLSFSNPLCLSVCQSLCLSVCLSLSVSVCVCLSVCLCLARSVTTKKKRQKHAYLLPTLMAAGCHCLGNTIMLLQRFRTVFLHL